MKKLLIIGLALIMIFAFAACGTTADVASDNAEDTAEDVAEDTAEDVAEDTAEDVAEEDADPEDTGDVVEEGTEDGTEDDTEEAGQEDTAESWLVKVGDLDVVGDTASNTFETVTQTLQKAGKDGSLEEVECTGYKISEILEKAGVSDFETLTVIAADGFEYELTADVALLDTTMLVTVLDGEAYDVPRFAVDGEGSGAWVKDVVQLKAD